MDESALATYRESARKRRLQKQEEMAQRRQQAWSVARRATDMLMEQFGASRVVVFGSLARGDFFHSRSDVDLAAWGLDPKQYYRAVGSLLALDPTLDVDLVMAEEAPTFLLATIEKEGKSL